MAVHQIEIIAVRLLFKTDVYYRPSFGKNEKYMQENIELSSCQTFKTYLN